MLRHKLNLVLVAIFILASSQVPQAHAAIKCLKCESSDANCITDLSKVTSETCVDTITDCFTSVDDAGLVKRGCKELTTECTAPNCYSCNSGDDCNKHNVCKACKDAECAQTDGSTSKNSVCAAADTKCFMTVTDSKEVERGCATTQDENNCNTATCQLCSAANCNVQIFPTNRLSCYQCASTDTKCSNVDVNTDIKSLPCRLYESGDKCFTFATGETSMTRGCVSDTDTNVNKCQTPEANEQCLTCTANNCNNRLYTRDQTLKCITCISSATDASCLWSQPGDSAKNCEKKIAYNVEDQCYTQTKDNNVHRGCLGDREESLGECTAENACVACGDADACNNKDTGSFTCIRCRSDEETKCSNNADELTGTECRNGVAEDEATCYHGKWNNVVIRGCLVDASEVVQETCLSADNKQCITCKEKDCNKDKTDGAATLTLTSGLLASILLALWRFS